MNIKSVGYIFIRSRRALATTQESIWVSSYYQYIYITIGYKTKAQNTIISASVPFEPWKLIFDEWMDRCHTLPNCLVSVAAAALAEGESRRPGSRFKAKKKSSVFPFRESEIMTN